MQIVRTNEGPLDRLTYADMASRHEGTSSPLRCSSRCTAPKAPDGPKPCLRNERYAVILVYGPCSGRIRPIPGIVIPVFRRALKLPLRHASAIAAQAGIVFQRLPWQRIVVIA